MLQRRRENREKMKLFYSRGRFSETWTFDFND